jgi:outer membrane receptor for ferrienterochelin and colicins
MDRWLRQGSLRVGAQPALRHSRIAITILSICIIAVAGNAPGLAQAETDLPVEPSAVQDVAPQEDFDIELDGDEDIFFQEIPSVFGVSRFEQKVTEAPSFVTILTSDDFDKYGYQTLAEALQSVTGFFVTYDRNYNHLGIRGFNRPGDFNSRVLLLVDGHRLNDNLYDQAGLGTEGVVDVDLIERVEVIRGPSSSLYGTNAFFGVINVITKRGRDVGGIELSAEFGTLDTYRGRVTYGDKFKNGLEVLLSGSYYSSGGNEVLFFPEFDDPATNNGITTNADYDSFPTVFGKLSFRDFTLQGGIVSREKGIPTGAYDTYFPTSDTNSLDQHAYIFLKYEHQFDNQLNVFGRVYYDNFFYRGNYVYDFAAAPPPTELGLNQDRSNGEWWGFETIVDKRLFDSHKVTGGMEFRQDFRQDLWNADLDFPPPGLDVMRDTWNIALFFQDEWSIFDSLILNAGVRFDYYESFGDTWNPRVALIYNIGNTTLKGMYGSAFRGPNAYERFYEGTGFVGNPNLGAERIQTAELVAEHAITPHFRATAAGYYYWINDLVEQVTIGGGDISWANRGETQAYGIEFQLEMAEWSRFNFDGKLGYALQEAKDRLTDMRLTNSPTHKLNFNLSAPVFRELIFGSLELIYMSSRNTLGGGQADDYTITNLTFFSTNAIKGLELSLSVRNLFGEKYFDPASLDQPQDLIEQNGRTVWFKIKYGF